MSRLSKEPVGNLFSEGTLGGKTSPIVSAQRNARPRPLHDSVALARLSLSELSISGESETLHLAARDIHAHLLVLEKTVAPDVLVSLVIDGARLPQSQPPPEPPKPSVT